MQVEHPSMIIIDTSLPVRGAWIEINEARLNDELPAVAPRAGSVD